jgi:hypothetical protein
LVRADSNELLVNVDQYGEHSDGRTNEQRGDEPLIVVNKKKPNNSIWTMVQQGMSLEECKKILDGYTAAAGASIYKSPLYPDYAMKR